MDKKITRPRRRASRLLARLLGADLVSGTYLEFVKMHAGYLLFTNMKSLFTNTLLIRVTGDNSLVMKFNLMQFICIPFAYTLGAFTSAAVPCPGPPRGVWASRPCSTRSSSCP